MSVDLSNNNPTAAIIIIGNEILSGRTLDINTQEIALTLGKLGIDLIETRTIADNKAMIVDTVRALSPKYDYIFTTGGIGPTHDDITAMSISEAFNVSYSRSDEIYTLLNDHYKKLNKEVTPAREKMAYVPEGSTLLYNDATAIPGFMIQNVFSMAGIPAIMKSMLKSSIPMLKKGKIIETKSLELMVGEGEIASSFENLQIKYKNVDMGSYPFTKNGVHGTTLVLRSSDEENLAKSFDELKQICSEFL